MATRKTSKKRVHPVVAQYNKFVSGPKSYTSLLYGVLTVLVLFAIVFLGIQLFTSRTGQISDRGAQTEVSQERVHVVKADENLWTIAEEEYGDGYKWTEIAKANRLKNADEISEGTRLVIPDLGADAGLTVIPSLTIEPSGEATRKPTQAASPTQVPTVEPTVSPIVTPSEDFPTEAKIIGNSYTVREGDNLWTIAVRAYGDGYKWVEIANANKLANPDLIYPGDKFNLPR